MRSSLRSLIGLFAGAAFTATVPALAQTTAPKYSNEFLNIGVGGRALGMGNVQAAIADGPTAGYWNPAGLVYQPKKFNAVLMHSELFSGIVKNDYGAFAMPLDDKSALGVSVIRMGVDDIADTRGLADQYGYLRYDQIQYFSVADYAFLVSYGRKLSGLEGLSVGANAKVIYRNVGKFANAVGFGLDAGAQLRRGSWQFGLMVKDVTSTFNAWSINADELKDVYAQTGNTVPGNTLELTLPRAVLGASRLFAIGKEFTVLAAVDLDATFDGKRNVLLPGKVASVDPRVGVEVGWAQIAYLRAGLNNVQKIKNFAGDTKTRVQPNFGVGVATNGLTLDLAISKVAANSDVSQTGSAKLSSIIVSLGYSFN
ncbi:MAG: PorV/PorQ family protein [Hymenobacteraceae bacterium]|nr:PorV/PorQ family protein [Hymenobacteraceae bacterium]